MAFIHLAVLILVAGYAINDAESTGWRFANLGIVVGSMVVGFVLASVIAYFVHAIQFWSQSTSLDMRW